ncbi:MAG: hypothetical protein PHQ43_11615 [Dehalococcoidales bacterium]|nr:hypothetical protein [Dehalococcoidales bacterium]
MNWFEGCESPSDVKRRYRHLAMKHHPDRGGDHESMVSINLAYENALKRMNGYTFASDDGKERVYRWDEAVERAAMEMVLKALSLRMHDVQVNLIGTWVWVMGDTKPYKDSLKEAGFRWHPKRACWYWPGSHSSYNKRASLGDLARWYGARSFESEDNLPA